MEIPSSSTDEEATETLNKIQADTDSQEFIKIAQRVREGLKTGHKDEVL